MGIKPQRTRYGTDCPRCWPAGKTPKYVKCFISGVKTGQDYLPVYGDTPNGYHDLVQHQEYACEFGNVGEGFPYITLSLGVDRTLLRVRNPHLVNSFYELKMQPCADWFTNINREWEDSKFYGGYAHVTVPGELDVEEHDFYKSLTAIVSSVTPMIDPDPRMECFPMADGKIAVRYAGKRDATNIMIKFDTTA